MHSRVSTTGEAKIHNHFSQVGQSFAGSVCLNAPRYAPNGPIFILLTGCKGIFLAWIFCIVLALALTAQAQTEIVLYSFSIGGSDGGYPQGGLIKDANGNLYGTTTNYGSGCGVVFELMPNGTEITIYTFQGGADGCAPSADLIRDSAGNLYGTTVNGGGGGGTVFKLSTSGVKTTLYSFTGGADGQYPFSALVRDKMTGDLYGTTYAGGASGEGTVFKVTPNGVEKVLHSFTGGPDGAFPFAGLVRDGNGNLYGTASAGGAFSNGTVFKRTATGKWKVLYSFTGGADGADPHGRLVRDTAGNLYGTTYAGGAGNRGAVFMLTPSGTETVLHSFVGGADGSAPAAGLLRFANGDLYGTTYRGGPNDAGTVFKVTAAGKEKVLYGFTGGTDGGTPLDDLIRDAAGNVYGTTYYGGDSRHGTVFEVTP